jgi:nitric oxide reductase NorQ protein
VIHPLTDARRILPLETHNEIVPAHADFELTVSFNPGYRNAVKDLKESTKQGFVAIDFGYPPSSTEAAIIVRESGTDDELAGILVAIAQRRQTVLTSQPRGAADDRDHPGGRSPARRPQRGHGIRLTGW